LLLQGAQFANIHGQSQFAQGGTASGPHTLRFAGASLNVGPVGAIIGAQAQLPTSARCPNRRRAGATCQRSPTRRPYDRRTRDSPEPGRSVPRGWRAQRGPRTALLRRDMFLRWCCFRFGHSRLIAILNPELLPATTPPPLQIPSFPPGKQHLPASPPPR